MAFWNFLHTSDLAAKLSALDKSQAIIEFNLDGTIINANDNFLRAMGYSLSEIKGRHHSLFVDPAYARSEDYRQFWAKLNRGEHDVREYKRLAKGGREVWIQASYNPVLGAGGKPVKVVKFATDITAQKLVSADVQGQVDAIGKSQAVIHFDLDGTILDANRNFLEAVGYSLDEVKGKHHRMFVDPAYARTVEYQQFWARLGRGEYDANEYKRIAKGGREIWIQASYNPILDMNGKPFKVVKFATDISAQKLTSADVNGQIEAIGKSQAVIHFNLDGTIIWANDNFLSVLGYSLAEIKGKHHSMFAEPGFAGTEEYRRFWERLRSGTFDAGEYKRIAKGGREVWIQASYNPIFDMNGKPFKVVKFASDITAMMGARKEVARLVGQSSEGVQGVAAASEELSTAVQEINVNMNQTRAAVDQILDHINAAGASSENLQKSSASMQKVVELIRDIAGQVNLLALNATIEAARAGAAGKGFSVVASEVKNLANQTAAATDSISSEIVEMQAVSQRVASIVGEAVQSADQVSQYVGGVASALEQQSVATKEISKNAQLASHSLAHINESVKRISSGGR